MFKLRFGYLIVGITTGLTLLLGFFWSIPDGKLHIVFCDVGQGDAAYIRFPDGRDMLVDGGPNDAVLGCLGRHMPFWDRHINVIALSHPQKDHMQGLISVLDRYGTDYFVRSDIANTTEGYQKLMDVVKRRNITQKFVTTGEAITVGSTTLSVLWPSGDQIANVLGASTSNLNDESVVFLLRYGSFDVLFPGDADTRVESGWRSIKLADDTLEVLKFPHHGSRTGMTEAFLETLQPNLAVISVGKNSYGHPSEATLATLAKLGVPVKRTDKEGDIEVISDGGSWSVAE